jgi:hypothetical protein
MPTKKQTEEVPVPEAPETETVAPEVEAKPKKEPRWHRVPGRIDREIVRSYYDPKQDAVKDVLKIPKIVQNRRGDDIEVVLYVHVRSRDEELQKKWQRGNAPLNIDIEEVD